MADYILGSLVGFSIIFLFSVSRAVMYKGKKDEQAYILSYGVILGLLLGATSWSGVYALTVALILVSLPYGLAWLINKLTIKVS